MKTPKLLLAILACVVAIEPIVAIVPTHESYVLPFTEGKTKNFSEYFENWDENDPQPFSEDENFYISRVPMKERIVNTATQVDPSMTQDRKFCMWTPMGISDTYWQSLPRYVFDGDNFNMWSYVDSQGGWSLPWVRVPGAYSDVTHRNGVANSGGLIFFDSWGGDNTEPQAVVRMLTTQLNSTTFKYTEKFVKFLRYYGVDGIGVNPEGLVPNAAKFQDFLIACREYAESIGWRFHVYWYGTNLNSGVMDLGNELTTDKANWFRKNGKQVVDMYMLNYGASGQTSINTVGSIGGSTYDVYVGYDIQGNWLQGRASWANVKSKPLSIVLWGNHNTNMIYQNSTEFGSAEDAVQKRYLSMQEQVFSGGNQNPAKRPPINEGITSPGYNAMQNWHGIAEFLPARSTMKELPFITRFGLGNGKAFYNEGKVTFNHNWFNVGVQDYLPTWRWWITDNNGAVPNDPINCEFTFEDAWFAGSAMHVQGATQVSNVRLFKTEFNVSSTDDISLTYKLNRGDAPNMELFWAFKGSESTLHYASINSTKKGEWVTISKKAQEIGMTGTVALIGLRFKNTPSYYDAYIGEFSIIPATSFNPIKPKITTEGSNILKKRTYQGIDFKFSWNVTPPSSHPSYKDKSCPIYNEDVDTWYYEVYIQAQGEEPILCGTTSQWAHYVVNAPVSANKDVTDYRVGVCAVAPDGKTKSQIEWTESYLQKEITLVDGIARDIDVIKSGDQFTLSILDPNQPEPKSWTIINAQNAATVTSQTGGRTFTTSLQNEGYYDIIVESPNGNKSYYRAFIQVSSMSTGKVPTIQSISASNRHVDLSQSNEVTLNYVGDNNEGTVSRGLELIDPYMFRIPQEYLSNSVGTYSIGMWIKPSKFTYANFGMSLINKRNYDRAWPNNNWGAFWVDVWPEKYFANGEKASDPHIVSYTMFSNEATDPYPSMGNDQNTNKHEVPNLQCSSQANQTCTPSHCFVANVWSHVLISYDGSKQRIYFNGMKVGEKSAYKYSYDECPIYIGGSRVYYSGFNGYIDDVQVWHKALSDAEVQDAMMGYWGREIPSDLKGYWTFEDVDYNADTKGFANRGTLTGAPDAAYIEVKASGEDTEGSFEEILPANINVTGNPAMSGTLPITTTATFSVGDVTTSGDTGTKSAQVELDKPGTYDLTLTLANGWGSTTLVNAEYIVVTDGSGVEDNLVNEMSVYPNPFIDHVNLLFAADGNYTVDLYDAQGRQLLSKRHQARTGEVFTLEVDAAQGLYYVVVSKEGKRTNTFKVVAQ